MYKEKIKTTLEVALLAGRIMLENGAETSRVEDTMSRICSSRNIIVDSFTIPTGIFMSYHDGKDYYPYVIRTKTMTIDLEIIAKVNDFSRTFVNGSVPLDDAKKRLMDIKATPHFPPLIYCIGGGLAGGFFTLSFGGRLIEALLSFVTSFLVVGIVKKMHKYAGTFVRNAAGGLLNAMIALTLIYLVTPFDQNIQLSKIVIGSLMPLVPGVAMTNAFRDSISGDFVSGVSKLTEALLVAVAIALGVGVVLHLKVLMTGSV